MPRVGKGSRKNRQHKPLAPPDRFSTGFLDEMDKRTVVYQTLAARKAALTNDLGDDVSYIRMSLVERFIWLEAHIETLEAELATGKLERAEGMSKWIFAVNCLSGVAAKLGLERRKPRMDLKAYLETKE